MSVASPSRSTSGRPDIGAPDTYDDTGAFSGRVRVAVPRMGVGEQFATTLALVLHELATNSLKYGALSLDAGMLDISGSTGEDAIKIVWTERGGPIVESGRAEGYGSKLRKRLVTGQLGGTITTDWSQEGIIVILKVSSQRLAN